MADLIEVNISTLETDISAMQAALERVKGDMQKMFESVQELDSMWDGPANLAFNQQFASDQQVFVDICDSVNGIIGSMENAKNAYRKCEAAVSAEIDGIRI